jgi:outer membrane protein OmpA-like peptidoglycan-associated protein
MPSQRFIVVGASMLLALGVMAGCGGITAYDGGKVIAINGTPPPPPPPPPPPAKEEPKPPARVELRDNKIEFKEKIQFEVNKSIIKEESFSLLKDIAKVIKDNPQVKKISIEGHASAEGEAKANKKLSDDRAKSVMKHLIDKEAINKDSLVAKGWGIEKPIGDNSTEQGREQNRRVEFLVVEAEVTSKKVEIDPKTGKEKIVEEKKDTVKTDTGTPAGPATPEKPPAAGAGGTPPKAGATPPKPAGSGAAPAAGATPPKPAGSAAPKPAGSATPAPKK